MFCTTIHVICDGEASYCSFLGIILSPEHTTSMLKAAWKVLIQNSVQTISHLVYTNVPHNLESNLHPFYSFRGLKNQMQIIIACGLDSWSRAGFWKSDRAAVCAARTIQYNNLLFYLLL
jgi:hypothetical protein